jgi:hypothetical protein
MLVWINISNFKSLATNADLIKLIRAKNAFRLSSETSALVRGVLFCRIFV